MIGLGDFSDIFGDVVQVISRPGRVEVSGTDMPVRFTPDEALKLAAAIRDAAVLAKEQA